MDGIIRIAGIACFFEEQGLKVGWAESAGEDVQLIAVDDALITDTKRCDALFVSVKSDVVLTLVELKTAELQSAFSQLEATRYHENFRALEEKCRSLRTKVRLRFVVVSSKKAVVRSNWLAQYKKRGISLEVLNMEPYRGKVVKLSR